MVDRQPTRAAGDERKVLLSLLRFHRDSFDSKLEGLDDDKARWSPVASGTNLLWLTKHLRFAEHIWLEHRFLGTPLAVANEIEPGDTLASVRAAYREAWPAFDAIIEGNDFDSPLPDPAGGPPIDLRWVVAHLLEEVARHAGHADILRELLDGQTGR